MQACAFISNHSRIVRLICVTSALFFSSQALAAASTPASSGSATVPSNNPVGGDEDEFKGPFQEYGEFHEDADEEADARFYQYGRFFGVSIGAGAETVSGNRGLLWQGGFPSYDLRIHYWFDFQLALNLCWQLTSHSYLTNVRSLQQVSVSFVRAGVDVVYYINAQNLSAPITFANPFLILGAGNFTKNETSTNLGKVDSDNNLGLTLGAGIEIAIKPRKSYFQIEGKTHMVNFNDTNTTDFQAHKPTALADLSGMFFTVTGSVLFTW